MLRYGTAYFELEADPAIFDIAIRALAEGNSLRSTARIVHSDKDTVGAWLDRAALQRLPGRPDPACRDRRRRA